MINKIRKFTGSVVAKVILAAVSLSFILFWGINDVFRRLTHADRIIQVGSSSVDISDFQEQFEKNRVALSTALSGQIDSKKLQSVMIQYTISNFVNDILLNLSVEHYDVLVTDDVLKYMTSKDPRFLDSDGRFSGVKFDEFLKAQKMSEEQFTKSLMIEGKALVTRMPIDVAYAMPDSLARLLKKAEDERRFARVYTISTSGMKDFSMPDEGVLREFYDENKESIFVIPEYREVDVFEFNEVDIKATVDEKEVRELYEKRKKEEDLEEGFDEVRKDLEAEILQDRNYAVISDATKELEDCLNSGKDFKAILAKHKFIKHRSIQFNAKNLDKAGHTAVLESYSDYLITSAFDSSIDEDVSFAEVGGGVWLLVKLRKVDHSHVLPYEEVNKQDVYAEWNKKKKVDAIRERAEKIAADLNAAKKVDANYKDLQPLIRQDIASLPGQLSPDMFRELFSLEPGKAVSGRVGASYVVAQLVKKESPEPTEEDLEEYKHYLRPSVVDDMFVGVMSYYKSNNPVKINTNLLKMRVSSEDVGDDEADNAGDS